MRQLQLLLGIFNTLYKDYGTLKRYDLIEKGNFCSNRLTNLSQVLSKNKKDLVFWNWIIQGPASALIKLVHYACAVIDGTGLWERSVVTCVYDFKGESGL